VFERRGFDRLETPAFECIEILTGKYGDDDNLIYKIAKRGAKVARGEADLALRYDFTVPLARFVAGNQELASRILRIYRIGPVWRADRPARGRFREFYQCDIDIVGSSSPIADAEVQLAVANALNALGISDFEIHLNSRRLLNELVCAYGVPASMVHQFFIAVDKLHEIGTEEVLGRAQFLRRARYGAELH
jgi:histidyl-tRNA synthetase